MSNVQWNYSGNWTQLKTVNICSAVIFIEKLDPRPDRDEYIQVQRGNIHKWAYEQFRKQDDSLTFNVSYDGLSLMHYNAFEGFGIDRNKPTMISLVSCYLNSLSPIVNITSINFSMESVHDDCYKILFWNLNHLLWGMDSKESWWNDSLWEQTYQKH